MAGCPARRSPGPGKMRGKRCPYASRVCAMGLSEMRFHLLFRFGFPGLAGLPLSCRCPLPFLSGSDLAMSRLVGFSGIVVALPCLEKALCGNFTRTFLARLVGSGRFWPVPVPSSRLRVSWSGPWWGFWRGVLFLSLLVLGWLLGSLALAFVACARGGRSPFVITLAVLRGLARTATVRRSLVWRRVA